MRPLDVTIVYLFKALLLPPGINFVGIVVGLVVRLRWRRFGAAFSILGFATLWLWSLPFVAGLLVLLVDHYPAFDMDSPRDPGVVVVLGGKRNSSSPEYDGDTVGADTLERIRYAAKLARALELPIAVTGGGSEDLGSESLGVLMAQTLTEEFHQPVRWIESQSRNTAENAKNLRLILPVDNIILVTHSLHMQRSVNIFEKMGFVVEAAPINIPAKQSDFFRFRLQDWLPSASALLISRSVLYERLGSAYYALRY